MDQMMTRQAPAFGSIETPDGVRLRTARWRPEGVVRGTVTLVTGRAEFIEKYQETAESWLARGFQVFALDWRNQGLSDRPLANRQKHHLLSFSTLRDDLAYFIDHVVTPESEGPSVLMAHSMGGLVATFYLSKYPERFRAAVLSAPMYAINLRRLPGAVARVLAEAACLFGGATRYAPGRGDYDPAEAVFSADNVITSDPRRYAAFHGPYGEQPELRVGGVTWGWLRAALRASVAVQRSLPLDEVLTPVLLLSAPDDMVVDSRAHHVVAKRFRTCTLIEFPRARHELLMECDAIRDAVWADIDAFLATTPV
ncbi:MAG TPA: alpha/beta hydrolase [Azospirillum sp.]|nr:alpha/beta hydrolase [Azospirillum sp.]